MKKFIETLKRTRLFTGISDDEILSMSRCLNGHIGNYKKGEYIFRQDEIIDNVTILVSGKLHIQKDDYWGNRTIIDVIKPGDMFGEAFAASQTCGILTDVVAVEDSSIIFFDIKRILCSCENACQYHSVVLQNMFAAISDKNIKLVQKLGHISRRTTREKLISYLSEESRKQNSTAFEIPFNRQQLADYLSVDRSAMSNELCKMRDEGLIKFNKNKFEFI